MIITGADAIISGLVSGIVTHSGNDIDRNPVMEKMGIVGSI